jgi:myo-inositol-1(or 4)-monophosphatase
VKRREWTPFEAGPLQIRAMGSVAYKLALVSAGLADITFTLTPKNEWDVAAGAALVISAGGYLATLDGLPFRANKRDPLLSGMIACGPYLREDLLKLLEPHLRSTAGQRAAE